MIARFRCSLAVRLTVRPSDALRPIEIVHAGHKCVVHVPFQAPATPEGGLLLKQPPVDPPVAGGTTLDEQPTFVANAIQTDIYGDFDRAKGSDGSDVLHVAFTLLEILFARLRTLGRSEFLTAPAEETTSWAIHYLNDDGSEFELDEGLVRRRSKVTMLIAPEAWIAPEIWGCLGEGTSIPASDELLLDAKNALPHLGSAMILANTAIEVRITTALDTLARLNPTIVSPDLWDWVTDRGDYRKEPSVDEKLTTLLKGFTGVGLNEQADLWPAFKLLRSARNSFAHEGRAFVDKARKTLLTLEHARVLVDAAARIVAWLESLLPPSDRTPAVTVPQRQLSRVLPFPVPLPQP